MIDSSSDTRKRIVEVLNRVRSESELVGQWPDDEGFWGVLDFTTPNGWRVGIFFDGGVWDYVDNIVTSDGEVFDQSTVSNMYGVENWRPGHRIAEIDDPP